MKYAPFERDLSADAALPDQVRRLKSYFFAALCLAQRARCAAPIAARAALLILRFFRTLGEALSVEPFNALLIAFNLVSNWAFSVSRA